MESTVREARDAYNALRRISDSTKLEAKAAWRTSRLLGKLKSAVEDAGAAEVKLYVDAGGVRNPDGSVTLAGINRLKDEADAVWEARLKEHFEKVRKLNDGVREINEQKVTIDYDPLPLSLFVDGDNVPAERRRLYSASDLVECGPFIIEEAAATA